MQHDPEVPLEDSARGGTKLAKAFDEDEAQLSADADASTLHVIGKGIVCPATQAYLSDHSTESFAAAIWRLQSL